MANKEINRIAGDLQALLENVKVKPIVVKASRKLTEEETLAPNLAAAVFRNMPENTNPKTVGKCIIETAKAKAEEMDLDEELLVEAVLDYCLSVVKTLSRRLDEGLE